MKKCKECDLGKPLSEFYKNSSGSLFGICKECKKNYERKRYHKNSEDPEWMNKERLRGREKYRKYKYKSMGRGGKNWIEKYPEKRKADIRAGRISCPEGEEKHHWSYNEEHWKDVIFLTKDDHNFLHRYLVYDSGSKFYKTLEGTVLDTREKHETYFKSLKGAMMIEA